MKAATSLALFSSLPVCALAQSAQQSGASQPSVQLPPVTVQGNAAKKPAKGKKAAAKAAAPVSAPQPAPATPAAPLDPSLALQADGTTAEGYRSLLASDVGPLGGMPLLTAPYSISVVSKDLLENRQATSTDEIFKLEPFVHNMWPQARGNPITTVMRGFTTTTTTLDNMRLQNAGVINPEGLERVEVLTGLSGFLYGPTDPGGVINFVQKSPTRFSFTDVTGGLIGESGYAHVDTGGAVAPGASTFYRLNVVRQDGGTAVDKQEVDRTYLSGAVDFELGDNALLQVKAFHSDYRATGSDPFWLALGAGRYPSAPDARKLWGQSWGTTEDKQDGVNAKLTWDINDVFTLRTGYGYINGYASNESISVNNIITAADGTYSQEALVNAPGTVTTQSGYAALDTKIVTGPVRQTITVGYSAGQYESELSGDFFAYLPLAGSRNFADPVYVPKPDYTVGTQPDSTYFTRGVRNAFVGDSIDVGVNWSAIVGLNYATVESEDYQFLPPAGQPRKMTSSYDRSEWTPTASLIYKPTKWASIYGTYIEGLEQGGVAPNTAVNRGEVLPPFVSKQYEAGVKALLGGAMVTVAAFDITKAYAVTDTTNNTFEAAGNQHNRGVEIGVSGKITDNLSVFGGFTTLNAKIEDDPELSGKKPVDVPEQMLKLYAEYALPFVPGLTLTGAINYASDFAAFDDNAQFLPEVVTGDLGFRYETVVDKTPVITRFNVTNVTDESYWMSSRFLGAPRALAMTVETKF